MVVDDERVVCQSCKRILESEGHRVTCFLDPREALQKLTDEEPDVALVDLKMPGLDGIEFLRQARQLRPALEVVIVTGFAEVSTAVRAMKLGAFDYVQKPFTPDQLLVVVAKALEHRELCSEKVRLQDELGQRYHFDNIIGSSPRMQEVYRLIERVAPTDSTVLIRGESGTGKELIAKAIHFNSPRRSERFLAVDCGALSETVLESEMFGHVKGAFTGAVASRKGFFEVANGGTLFLDEIGNVSANVQARLLRVLQEREFKPVGASEPMKTDIRLIAATNRDLEKMVQDGEFREELYYRLNIFPIELPPLRERRDDIPQLALHFLERCRERTGGRVTAIDPDALELLARYDWPGNVRQLENVVQRAMLLASGDTVRAQDVPPEVRHGSPRPQVEVPRTWDELRDLKKRLREESVEEVERQFVVDALARCGGNATRAAEAVGMLRPNFQALMKKHDVRRDDA
ncbi:MAG: sigma-54-dependent Fis family transcriptional regulator [Planctomycetes bacterium]|nr:sigma-54-dependent Fis family transcriptional regulator [Planctomycetota bacterium]